jgi:hypothetical protein
MIIKFKIFESNNLNNLKKGDYIIVKSDDDRIDNELCIVTDEPIKYKNNITLVVKLPDYLGDYLIYPHEIVKVLTKEEAELYKNQEKYNL